MAADPIPLRPHRQLNNLAETMTSLAAYLLAPQKHARYILGDPDEQAGDNRSVKKLRVTQHYTAALLAYGIPPHEPELLRAADWFALQYQQPVELDTIEMTKLEGLLNLRPDDPVVQPRLQQLINQRVGNAFEINNEDEQGNLSIFNTLWALKIIMLARTKGVLDGLVDNADIRRLLNQTLKQCIHDKDQALALRLLYELDHKLDSSHQRYLQTLLERTEENGYVWGAQRNDMREKSKALAEAMARRQLTPGLVDTYQSIFRDIILNTCYVIENLALLDDAYPAVREPIQRAMELWWQQIQGGQAVNLLRMLFPDEYDFLLVLCRTMVTVSTYIGEPLGARCWLPSLRETSQKFAMNEWPEKKSIDKALRRWIGLNLGEPLPLKLGLSEANVIRIQPSIYSPTDEQQTDLLRRSLVVKYGPIEEIENERKNYDQLPHSIRTHFVRIPQESYINKQRQAFVIMEDLSDYFTLYEIYDRLLKADAPKLPHELGGFLFTVHHGEGQIQPANGNHLRDIYLLPLMQQISEILDFYHRVSRQMGGLEDQMRRFQQMEHKLNQAIAGIMKNQSQLETFPLAYMHGDLHSRNIMIRVMPKLGQAWGNADLVFKLIDLEKLRLDGDAAHDAGQLLIDLYLIPVMGKRDVHRQVLEKLEVMQDTLEQMYLDFAESRQDKTFATRLDLAKARALIRIAKGIAKRSDKHLKNREHEQAVNAVHDSMNLVEWASFCLENAHNAVR